MNVLKSYQHIIMTGNIGHEPELTFSKTNGLPVTNFTLYLNDSPSTVRVSCVAFGDEAKEIYEKKKKGATLTLQLELFMKKSQDGKEELKHKVIRLLG